MTSWYPWRTSLRSESVSGERVLQEALILSHIPCFHFLDHANLFVATPQPCLSLTAFVDVLALELTELEVCVDFGEVRVDEELLVAGASGVMHAFSPLLNTNFTLCGFVETVRRSPLERFFAPLFETGEPFTNTFALLEKAGLTEN